jgi:SAM-dependent methyltransferase
MEKMNVKYVHEEIVHNCRAAIEVVPFVIKLLQPRSVVDVGCGIGTWLQVFQENKINDVVGIDGEYVEKKQLKISTSKFIAYDLETLYKCEKQYDLAISLEVAEHLSKESSDVFVETLSGLSDTIIFSAAIPNQGGQNHINEREPKYWIEKFEKNGFKLYDVLRPVFWDNQVIDPWYRQNMLLFTKNIDLNIVLEPLKNFEGKHLVHPELSKDKDDQLNFHKNQLEYIYKGKKDVRFYLYLLFKALKRKIVNG